MRSFALIVASLAVQALASPFVKRQGACTIPQGTNAVAQPADNEARTWLALHNAHRANHTNTCSLLWDAELAQMAYQSASKCQFAHDINGDYGQNIAEGFGGDNLAAAAQATGMWYNEIKDFDPYWGASDVPMSEPIVLHFTQMVWQETHSVGCGIVNCGGTQMSFCNYRTAGNFAGNYAPNVARVAQPALPPICDEGNYSGGACIPQAQLQQYYV